MIQGIKQGEADSNEDGLVDMDELYEYIHQKVPQEGPQEPMKWGIDVRGELIIARSGKTPRDKRNEQIREKLLDLARKRIISDRLLTKAFEVIALDPAHQGEQHRAYDTLLNRLLKKPSEVGEFIEEWYKVSQEPAQPSVPEAIKAEPTEARTPEHTQVEPKVTELPRVKPEPTEPKPAEPKTVEPELGKPVVPEPKPIRPMPIKPVAAKRIPTEQKVPKASKANLIMALGGLICLALLAAVFAFELGLKSIIFGVFADALVRTSIIFTMGVSLAVVLRVNRIVNLAHGSFYVLGAYVAHSLAVLMGLDGFGFFAIAVLAALLIGMLGVFIETSLLRRVYQLPVILRLLCALGVVLVLRNVIMAIWGPDLVTSKVTFISNRMYTIPLGSFVLAGLIVLFHRTRWFGKHYQATADQGDGVGTNAEHRNFRTAVFFIATALAAFTGAFTLPQLTVHPYYDIGVLVNASLVTLLAGLGSPVGAFLAAMVIGTLGAFSSVYWGVRASETIVFIVAAPALTLRPTGFFGRTEPLYLDTTPVRLAGRPGRRLRQAAVAAVILLLAVPVVAGSSTIAIMVSILVFALVGASLHFLIKTEGFVSLGHGAFVAIGAYCVAILSVRLGLPFALAVLMGAAAAWLCGLLFAIPCTRLSPTFAAMLSLVFAHAMYSTFYVAEAITGGDSGLLLSGQVGKWEIYYSALLLCTGGIALLWYLPTSRVYSQAHEYAGLTAQVNSARLGAHKRTTLSFALAGAIAGLAGGLFAIHSHYVEPTMFRTEMSFDGLSMLVIGGVQSFLGPLLGALFGASNVIWLGELTSRGGGFWQVITGATVIVIVLLYPKGILGLLESLLGEKHLTNILPIWKTDKRPTEHSPEISKITS